MTDTAEPLTVADVERQKLQRHFGRFDILFFLICTIVGVDTIATVAQGGGEAFTWMMIFAVVFFVPQALLFAELGAAFPQEGGPYFWTPSRRQPHEPVPAPSARPDLAVRFGFRPRHSPGALQ